MKEFTIEDFVVNNDNSVTIDYYFFSNLSNITFTEEELKEVLDYRNVENLGFSFTEYLHDIFNEDDCIVVLKYYIRDYAPKKQKL